VVVPALHKKYWFCV